MAKFVLSFVILSILIVNVLSSAMMYKKVTKDIYEADLVAVSSTVIPVVAHEVDPILSKAEYKKLYMKHIHKKVAQSDEDPDTLITINKKFNDKV